MEYAQFVETVGKIEGPNLDEEYGSLMLNEANTLRIIERVAADTRRDTISSNDVWNMSIKRVLDEFITFWISLYVHAMKRENDILVQKMRSPTGMFHIGLTLFIVLTVILVCT
jgi:hypothetical protein